MSAKTQAVLDEIKAMPPDEFQTLWQEVSRLAVQLAGSPTQVSDAEFAAALDEVTACTSSSPMLQRLLEDRRRDRERDEARLAAHNRNRARG
jgi:hypothetical protein